MKLRSYLESKAKQIQKSIVVTMEKSVDNVIKKQADPHTAVSTSDTEIIETAHKTVDIPDYIITNVFRREILDLQSIVNQE
jgi:hypothetical protein